jgi:N-dimethylarginine dimethylaminohydrolase
MVGRSYPPEFYSWITVPHVRSLFEKIAIETEEDYQAIIKKLQEFGVSVLRPNIPSTVTDSRGAYLPSPMTPRDYTVMIGGQFFLNAGNWAQFYKQVRDNSWPAYSEFDQLPKWIQQECINQHGWIGDSFDPVRWKHGAYEQILQAVNHNTDKQLCIDFSGLINGAMVSRIGRDLYFGTLRYLNQSEIQQTQLQLKAHFPEHRCHLVNTGGHSDGTFCPVTPGLIISLHDVSTYAATFPGWEVVYLPNQSWSKVQPFLHLKQKNNGKWWIPGWEHDQAVIDVVEQWLNHWTGYVEETVFDVNMLIIDPKNVMVFNYNQKVFDTLSRYGITPHIVPFRHRYFWDGGIHCVTSDLHREGVMQNYFPERD